MATQLSIAKQLNLSKATVSRILSGNTSHDDETRARVLTLAAQLGYRHLRPTVRQRTARKPIILGVTIEVSDENPAEPPVIMMRALRGISSAARMENVAIRVEYFPVQERPHLAEHELALSKEKNLAGLILAGGYTPRVIQELTRKLPCVRLNNRESNVDVDCVGQNDADAVESLVAHLNALGHERIGFMSGPEEEWPASARQAAYFRALAQRGRLHDAQIVVQPASPTDSAPGARVEECIARGVRAWICYHDGVAYDLVRDLRRRGLRVPEDVSVCAFDNLPAPGKGKLPKITSIDWPFEDIGAAAARRLLRRIQEPAASPVYMQLNGRLVEGRSTGPCPGTKHRRRYSRC